MKFDFFLKRNKMTIASFVRSTGVSSYEELVEELAGTKVSAPSYEEVKHVFEKTGVDAPVEKGAVDKGVQFGLQNPYQEPFARLLVESIPCAEKVVFCNSGTEASMFAIRAARSFTGKTKIAMFEGGFHGAHDYVLAKVVPTSSIDEPDFYSMGQGIPVETQSTVKMLPYLNDQAFDLIRKHADELALVLIEPVQGSNP